MNGKHLILIILLAGFVLSLGYAWWSMPRQQRIVAEPNPAPATVETEAGGSIRSTLPHIRFDLLGEKPKPFPGAKRDIFNFHVEPVEIVASSAPAPPPAPSPPPPPPLPSRPSSPSPPPLEQKPLSSFSFLGFLEVGKEVVVFLSSGEQIYLVREGERFGRNREFEVADISDHVLTVNQHGQANPVKVFLVEKEKPDLSVSSPARRNPLPPVSVEATDISQGMSAPARLRRAGPTGGEPEQPQSGINSFGVQGGFVGQEPSVDTGSAEGEMNGTNQ
ncbi:MAG TPA: hypothetical protein VJ910_07050 [Desulfuromonadales bacterium]|nr:hypothetical protein [Desulfuromonadales bacterium]